MHELVRWNAQFDWAHKFYHTHNWFAIAARHFFDELTLGQNAIEFHIATNVILETGFTNLQFVGLASLAHEAGDYLFEKLVTSSSWEKFRDPRETTYTKYTELQMEKEIFVDCILEEIEANGYDRELQPQWIQTLETLVAPFRYPGHALMMIAAYVAQMAPGGRIVVAATFQAGDEARPWPIASGSSNWLFPASRLTANLFGNKTHAGNRCASSSSGYSSLTIGARLSSL
jgi:hypothetical protein